MQERMIGAREKLANAQKIKMGQGLGKETGKSDASKPKIVPLLFVLGLATTLAALLSTGTGPLVNGDMEFFGNIYLDTLFFGPGIPDLTAVEYANLVLTLLARGMLIAALSGVVPFITWCVARISDKVYNNVYVMTWGTITGLLLGAFMLKDSIAPTLKGLSALLQR